MMARARVGLVALLLLAGSQAAADETKGAAPRLDFSDYLRRVLAANPICKPRVRAWMWRGPRSTWPRSFPILSSPSG